MTAAKFRTEVLHISGKSLSELSAAIQKASISILPKKVRRRTGCFKQKENIIHRDGLEKTAPANVKSIRKADVSLCKTPKENAEVFRVHFEKLFSKTLIYDPLVLEDCDAPTNR